MTAYFRLTGWSDRRWRLAPAHQIGAIVRLECDDLLTDEGNPTWCFAERAILAPYGALPAVHAVARSTDPSTSHGAAQGFTADRLRADHRLVLAILHVHGPLTDFALARQATAETGSHRIQTSLGVRRGELTTAGLVADSGFKGKSDTGRPSIRWTITAAGREALGVRTAGISA